MEVSDPRRAEFIKSELSRLSKELSNFVITTGTLLREYKSGGYFKEDGFKSFDEAIESFKDKGMLDYGARQARNLIAIVDMIEALAISAGDVNALGISKLREIASLRDPATQQKLLEAASGMSVGEVQKEAKRLRDKASGRDEDPLDPVTLLMSETQKQFYKNCIDRARQVYGLNDDVPEVAVLVDAILADWFSGTSDGISEGLLDDTRIYTGSAGTDPDQVPLDGTPTEMAD